MPILPIRDVSLHVNTFGSGYPLLLMHGGPGVDQTTLYPLRSCADRLTLVFYDHRCNGRSTGAEITSMTWENLTADADQLRQSLGFDQWAVIGHSFGGMVALEYALRYPQHISHLILLDTCGDIHWAREYAPKSLSELGYDEDTVALAQRFFKGEIQPGEMSLAMRKFGQAYYYKLDFLTLAREVLSGFRMKSRPEALIFGFKHLLKDWNVMDRLGEITMPTLVMAGRHDFQFPPEHQEALAAGIAHSRLKIIDEAGHNVLSEQPEIVKQEILGFLTP